MCNFTGDRYTCPTCGQLVDYGTIHYCSQNPSFPQLPLSFNYECPGCNGRFNTPAYDYQFNTNGNAKCPFCGREMAGLNQ